MYGILSGNLIKPKIIEPFYELVCDLGNKASLGELFNLVKSFMSYTDNPTQGINRDEYLATSLSKSSTWRLDQVRVILALIAFVRSELPVDEATLARWVAHEVTVDDIIGPFKNPEWWKETQSVSPLETAAFTLWATFEVIKHGAIVPGVSDNASLLMRWNAMDPIERQPCMTLAVQEQRFKDLYLTARRAT